ncbi:hypothetical protein KSP40_PGU009010 [Platanthera guangdongensis]|uniref:Uncharacterized protein n=1 Tax=Platanthera guangdongensis TaxID=2320717 RepID=A0ABR2LBU7_9ASPA
MNRLMMHQIVHVPDKDPSSPELSTVKVDALSRDLVSGTLLARENQRVDNPKNGESPSTVEQFLAFFLSYSSSSIPVELKTQKRWRKGQMKRKRWGNVTEESCLQSFFLYISIVRESLGPCQVNEQFDASSADIVLLFTHNTDENGRGHCSGGSGREQRTKQVIENHIPVVVTYHPSRDGTNNNRILFFWAAYEELCALGDAEDANECFNDAVSVRTHLYSSFDSSSQGFNGACEDHNLPLKQDSSPRQSKQLHTINNIPSYPQSSNCVPSNLSLYNTPFPPVTQLSGTVPPPVYRNAYLPAIGGDGPSKPNPNATI